MSLISDKQRENAQQPEPTITPIRSASESLELGSVGSGQEFQLSEQETITPELPEVPEVATEPALDFSLTQSATTKVEGGFSPKDPRQLFTGVAGRNIWEPVSDDKSPYAPEILQTSKPTTYDTSVINTNAAALNARGMAGVTSSLDNYSKQQQQAAQAEADFRARLNNRAENTNIPRKQQPWGSMVGQAFNDILFGSKQSQEEAARSVVNPFKLQYGKQGAGVGGWVKYVLGAPLNATTALAADINQTTVNVLTRFGVNKEQAQRFARGGVLGIALDATIGKKKTDELGKRFGLQQDWSKTQGRSATLEAIVRGESYGDVNDPKGNSKGVFYREARPRRTEAETQAASLGKYDVVGAGGIVQAAKDDPVGAGYEILWNLLDPAGNKLGDIVGAGIRNIGKAPTPKPAPVKGVQTPAVNSASKKPQRALPPGKVQGTPVEQQLQELWGNQIPKPPRAPGEARLPPAPTQNLPMLPGTPPAGGFPKINLGDGIPVTGTRVIQPDEGYLPSGATRNKPKRFVSFPSDAEQAAKNDPWKPLDESPIQMGATLESAAESNVPKLSPGKFTAEQISSPWDDKVDFIDVAFEPITSALATPTKAPRIYNGDFRVVQKALPPALDNVTDVIPEAIVGTPSEVVFRVGVGNPSSEPIVFNESINIGEPKTVEFNAPLPETQLELPNNLESLGNRWREFQKYRLNKVNYGQSSYEEDIAPRISDVIGNVQRGDYVRSVNALVEFVRKENTFEEASEYLGVDARKLLDETWAFLVSKITPKQAKGYVGNLLNKTPDEVSESELLLLNKAGLRNWSGKQWVSREISADELKRNTTQPKTTEVSNAPSAPIQNQTPVLNKTRADESQELIELQTKEARDEPMTELELARMQEIEDAQMQGLTTYELAQKKNISNLTTEQLEQAAEQLASHKAVIQAPLQQLDQLFDDTVDFGRKVTDELPHSSITSDGVYEALENNAKLNLPPEAYLVLGKRYGDEVAEALRDADYVNLSELLTQKQIDLETFVREVAEVNNALVNGKATAAKPKPTTSESQVDDVDPEAEALEAKTPDNTTAATAATLRNTIKMPAKVLHGTALAGWQPSYNLRLNGSRGELGSGLYVTNRATVAEDYAKAIISENVSPGANAKDIAPAIYELSHSFEQTFSARGKLAPTDPIVKAIVAALPEQLQEAVRKSIGRDSSTNLVGILNKIEANLVRSSLSPTEEVLKDVNLRVSDTLRSIGYDSVYDSKSGFGLVLDETKVSISKSKPVPPASSPTQAALARYNADAYAAKFYQERLTTDANLRDSAYKLLSQLESNVDDKLREVQQEIIKRGLQEQSTVLPPKQTFKQGVSLNDSKPNNISEVLDTIEPKSTNPCEF